MKIVGLMVCGPGEVDRFLRRPLEQFKKLCDDVVICLNGNDENRDRVIKDYGFWSYHDDREWGIYQPKIKTDLLKRIGKLRPDWVLPLDADEEMVDMTRQTLEEISSERRACYYYIVNLWNDEFHYKRAISFWNIRFFKFMPSMGLEYIKKPVHCGLAPPYAYTFGTYVPHLVRHYGLMKSEDREKKVERYSRYDPQAKHLGLKSWYDALRQDGTGTFYDEVAVTMKIREEVSKMIHQKKYHE